MRSRSRCRNHGLAVLTAVTTVSTAAAAQSFKFYDDGEVALLAIPDGGVLEPGGPLTLNGTRVDDPDTPGSDTFTIIDFYDRVPGTGSYPISAADIIANGFIRPLVQLQDGSSTAFGTSVVTAPSFRPQGDPLDLIPDMLGADVFTGENDAEDRIAIENAGVYGTQASVVTRHLWPDPVIGRTETVVSYTWVAGADITLVSGGTGRGFDAFRLVMFSSMLAGADDGVYDARYLRVSPATGPSRTIEIPDAPRDRHLFAAPVPVAVGGAFSLLKDNLATWNPGGPSLQILIESVSVPGGQFGVQAYLAGTTNPNDDSLSVWLEWVDAPAVILAGTTIEATFRVVATPPTDLGDLDHDGAFTRADAVAVFLLRGRAQNDPDFDAYADINRDGEIGQSDFESVVTLVGFHPADFNSDGSVDTVDVLRYLNAFTAADPAADYTGDGLINTRDVLLFLNLFGDGR